MKGIVYIAGKVSGLDYEEVRRKFNLKQAELEQQGYEVINPVLFCTPSMTWEECMRWCIKALCSADHICLLPDWQHSKGARIEQSISVILGISPISE